MDQLRFDLTDEGGRFKPLNATNGGPWHKRHATDQYRSNFAAYKAARIPYSRNHDSFYNTGNGGPYAHDVSAIFPNFDADPNDPASYDFACTDENILVTLEAGTETFYRLGQSIEHHIKKHQTIPPKDFQKWAVICEHIVRHYNEGWADGYHLNIQYWEIWNEPDLDLDNSTNKRMWGGTTAQFYDFYATAAKHLKSCFPDLKFGGPALAHRSEWAEAFLNEMRKRNVELDFFSWHIYCTGPEAIVRRANFIRVLLARHGYGQAESVLNEWNYVKGWTDQFVYSLKMIHGIKGAAFMLACMSAAQAAPIDLLMYYDTRPSSFNGVFDFYTYEPLKGYFAFYWYGMFYDRKAEIRVANTVENIYTLCGVDESGRTLTTVTYYSDDDGAADKDISIDFGRPGRYEIYLLDEGHNGELVDTTDRLTFTMKVHSALLIKEI